jgi:hypothetical protein
LVLCNQACDLQLRRLAQGPPKTIQPPKHRAQLAVLGLRSGPVLDQIIVDAPGDLLLGYLAIMVVLEILADVDLGGMKQLTAHVYQELGRLPVRFFGNVGRGAAVAIVVACALALAVGHLHATRTGKVSNCFTQGWPHSPRTTFLPPTTFPLPFSASRS